jgi:UDP-N-acetylglucosamine--N-acetylmuramyl-(pentapeptide) pyrophosphoryl-undecaprenol N-acetylglucosamine transferase
MKVLMTCGGTGGHIYPALAIAKELELKYKAEIYFAGRLDSMEENILKPMFPFLKIRAWPLVRGKVIENCKLPFRLILSLYDACKAISISKANIVVGTGGYVSLPVVVMAGILGKRVYIQEQNVVAGITNKIGAKFAKRVFVVSSSACAEFDEKKVQVTGNPIRQIPNKNDLTTPIDIEDFDKIVLALGGSQGAQGVNQKIQELIPLFVKNQNWALVWQCGKNSLPSSKSISQGYKNIFVKEFVTDIYSYINSADLLISRAGASTITEILALGKPSILIPYPYATANHQEANARRLERGNAAKVVLEDDDIDFISLVDKLLLDKKDLIEMAENALRLSETNAARIIADQIFKDSQ